MTFRARQRSGEIPPIVIPLGRITGITPSPRTAGRFDLLVEGEPVARLSIDAIERLGIVAGTLITEASAAAIASEAEIGRTYDRAMAMLAMRGRASGELRRLLLQKGEQPGPVDQAIRRLETFGLLDDAAFARQFTRWKATAAGLSRRRIERELTRRGIDRDVVSAAISETFVEEGIDETAMIEEAAQRKLRSLTKVDPETRRRRLYGYLARRGFEIGAVGDVVKRLASHAEAVD